MVLRPFAEPEKMLFRFGPGIGEKSFSRALTIRIHEIIAQVTGLNATDDLGFIGCCAVTKVGVSRPEVWLDFRFKNATYADTTGFSGGATYYPKQELNALRGYLFMDDATKSAIVTVRDIPEYNKKGEVDNVQRKVAVLRIPAVLVMCILTILDHDPLDPTLLVRYALTERGNAFMDEYVDPDLVGQYLPIDITATVSAKTDERYDVDKMLRLVEENSPKLIPGFVATLPADKAKVSTTVETTSSKNKEKKKNKRKKPKYDGKGGA